jgi:hypothetical protein
MILLHDSQNKESRDFYFKYKSEFEKVLFYPELLKVYPTVAKFPAVVLDVPEYTIDNSLWYHVTKRANYRRLGFGVKSIVKSLPTFCSPGIDWVYSYSKKNNLDDGFEMFLIEACNDFTIPAEYVATWGLKFAYDLGSECKQELDPKNKERCIYKDSEKPLLEIVPAHQVIIYPNTLEDVLNYKIPMGSRS